MCGIAGVVRLGGQALDASSLRRMGDVMAHRGPDDRGEYLDGSVGLVHRRLAIIDLSRAGHQPMTNEDGTLWLVYNGEIYNYLELMPELRARGHVFRSRCDSEVVLHAYEEWGPACLHRFNGMFAIAVWDTVKRQLWLARDRLGVKPLYYVSHQGSFAFASEIKALRQLGGVGLRAHAPAIAQYLQLGYPIDDTTWFEGVRRLMPGCTATLTAGGRLTVEAYWDPVSLYHEPCSGVPDQGRLRGLLESAVALRLRSDVPVGAHLSGGLDSSSVVGLMARHSETPVHTFSGAFDEGGQYDEREFVRVMTARFGTVHHEVVPRAEQVPEVLSSIVWHMDEPSAGYSVFSQFEVNRLVQQMGIKVVNGGQGGDEVFGGYTKYLLKLRRERLRHADHSPATLARNVLAVARAGALRRAARRLLDDHGGRLWHGHHPDFAAAVADPPPVLPRVLDDALANEMYNDLRHYLPALLHVEDRTSMAFSIESRIPLLDYRLVEFAAGISVGQKLRDGVLKAPLRAAMRGVLPEEIVDRKDKRGFPTPMGLWLRGPLHDWAGGVVRSEAMREARVLSPRHLDLVLSAHRRFATYDGTRVLWPALNVAVWFERFGVTAAW